MLNLLPGIHTHDVMLHPTTRPALLKCTEVYFPNLDELSLRLVAALPKACIGQTGEGSGGGDGDECGSNDGRGGSGGDEHVSRSQQQSQHVSDR